MPDRRAILSLALAAVLAPAALATATERPVNTLGSTENVAIRGYDPVSYFTEGAPRLGQAAYSVRHGGAVWHFSSARNKALFEADPERYRPAYGGFCAYGTSRGYLVKIEPEAWSIVDGRLYLNYDLSVRRTWSRDSAGYIAKADGKWPKLGPADID